MSSPDPAGDRLATLRRMLEAEPDDEFCLYGIAQEHARRDEHDEAIAWYDRLLAAHPDHGYGHFHRARSLEELDRIDEAIATLRAGLEAARRSSDQQAIAELGGYLDQLT